VEQESITEKIIGCAYKVHRTLGPGFLEKIYENALVIELNQAGLAVQQQCPLPVYYAGAKVGEYYADLLVNNQIIVELKASEQLVKEHEIQLVNYLAATGLAFGLLLNFGRSVNVKRKFRHYENPVNPEKSC
jgi:GxxExxY protein